MQSFENASGNARLSMMNVCGEIIKNNPLALFLGSGFTALTNAIVTSGVYATGAFIVSFATVAGIPVAIFVYYPYILKPILKKKNIILGLADWNSIFNVSSSLVENFILVKCVRIVFIGIMLQIVLKIITSILYAYQRSAIVNALALFTNILILLFLLVLPSKSISENLLMMSWVI